jgi:hypothetical protein
LIPLVLALAVAAPPPLAPTTEGGLVLPVPEGWKLHAKREAGQVTVSAGLTTTATLFWYPYRPLATPDLMLDIVLSTVNDMLPIGTATEDDRAALPGFDAPHLPRRAAVSRAHVTVLGYRMDVAMIAVVDRSAQRLLAGFLLAPPETFAELDGVDLVTELAVRFRLAEDPVEPVPGWWWEAAPPPAVARPPEATP